MEQRGFKFDVKAIDEQGVFEGLRRRSSGTRRFRRRGYRAGGLLQRPSGEPEHAYLRAILPREPIGVTHSAVEDARNLWTSGVASLTRDKPGREALRSAGTGAA